MAAISRKRAPLVHRSSNVEASSDWTNACKKLATIDTPDTDESLSNLVLYIVDCTPSDPSCTETVLQLLASRLSKFEISAAVRSRVIDFLCDREVSGSPFTFPLVRLLVKQERNRVIEWKKSNSYLGIELAAWDSLSDGHDMKHQVIDNIVKRGLSVKFSVHLSLAPHISIPNSCGFGQSCRRLLGASSLSELTDALESFASSRPSESGEKNLAAGLIINVIVWTCRLLGSDQLAIKAIELTESVRQLEHQRRLLQALLGVRLYQESAQDMRLTKLLLNVTLGEPLRLDKSRDENRYEVALLSLQIALRGHRNNDLVTCVVHALYSLHCLKFSEFVRSRIPIDMGIGTEGLLSVLYSEKALQAVVPIIPPLAKIFTILESVRIAAFAYEQMGYVPGASWLLHKGLEYIGLIRNEQVACRVQRYRTVFKTRLRALHVDSETAISDGNIDNSLFQEADSGLSLIDPFIQWQQRLSMLRAIVLGQTFLRKNRLGRLDLLRDEIKSTACNVECMVRFSVDDTDNLIVSVLKHGEETLSERACSDVTNVAFKLINEMNSLLSRNKETISNTNDTKEFWNDRREIDKQMEALIDRMQFEIFRDAKNIFCMQFFSDTVWIDLPDILLALPVENFPLFRSSLCFRASPSCQAFKKPVDKLRGSYVVNPAGDCNSTESTILPLLKNWCGKSGRPTATDYEFLDLLKNSDVFLYSGHGGGERHWSGSSIQWLASRDSVPARIALLMGCGSARPYGDYTAVFSTPFHYLIAGFGIVVGTLWDVLGRELDKVSAHLIQAADGPPNANEFVQQFPSVFKEAKSKVKLRFLSGASLVVYADPQCFN
jgi:hypothetical protein